MPEAMVIHPAIIADPHLQRGQELMLNTGRGCVLTAQAADVTVVGLWLGHMTTSMADGGLAVQVESTAFHEGRRDQGAWLC
ncbi:hypothetical protein PSDVSF_12550 [Pseudodesulfovibrio sediminis]|uniref:Uncharacterized protein n=1 Tax=Pseudodesulfovibrio sediminis TaxID=2810563 RepID=A0ABM7P556_9BACT|nr:hypothetical protein PSDVSF_12550 [Pseudodesulfovibrio sediminis]